MVGLFETSSEKSEFPLCVGCIERHAVKLFRLGEASTGPRMIVVSPQTITSSIISYSGGNDDNIRPVRDVCLMIIADGLAYGEMIASRL